MTLARSRGRHDESAPGSCSAHTGPSWKSVNSQLPIPKEIEKRLSNWELSHFTGLTCLQGMGRNTPRIVLAAVVALHLLVSLVHGWANGTAGVGLNAPSMAFVLIVIILGPLVGLAWMWRNPAAGARIIGVTMAASLLFGLVNHFILASPDRVDFVVGPARTLFEVTAVMLVLSEAAGAVLGLSYGRSRRAKPSYIS